MHRTKQYRTRVLLIALISLTWPVYGQATLDQQAWNLVWDRFDKVFPKGNDTNIVHALEIPVPATWADSKDDYALEDLAHLAGSIPEATYVIHPSRMQRTLQDTYTEIVLAVQLEDQSPEKKKAYQAAFEHFETARQAYEKRREDWDDLWQKRLDLLKKKVRNMTQENARNSKESIPAISIAYALP